MKPLKHTPLLQKKVLLPLGIAAAWLACGAS